MRPAKKPKSSAWDFQAPFFCLTPHQQKGTNDVVLHKIGSELDHDINTKSYSTYL